VHVRRHAAARVDPRVDVQHLAAVVVRAALEAVALAKRRVFDDHVPNRNAATRERRSMRSRAARACAVNVL
jgi:hypothetical protein